MVWSTMHIESLWIYMYGSICSCMNICVELIAVINLSLSYPGSNSDES